MQCCTCKYNHVTIKYYVGILSLISQILTEHIYQTEMYIDCFVCSIPIESKGKSQNLAFLNSQSFVLMKNVKIVT